jgi:hypothetical protein
MAENPIELNEINPPEEENIEDEQGEEETSLSLIVYVDTQCFII